MKHYILALVLAMASINAAIAANPIREGNMISGHVLVKGSEENIPYATVLIVGSGQGTVSNEEGQFELKNLPAGKYTLRVSAVGYKTQEKEIEVNLKSATKLFSVLLASKRPLITELADKLRLKYPLLPTISPCPTMRLEAIRSIIPISCRRYPKSV